MAQLHRMLFAASVLTATATTPVIAATTNYVLSLESPADYVEVPDSDPLRLANNFTLEAWVKVKQFVPSEQGVISKRGAVNGEGYSLRVSGGKVVLAMSDNVSLTFSVGSAPEIQTNEWHHIAGTYDGSIAKVYLDGVMRASTPVSLKLGVSTLPFNIGQQGFPNDPRNFVGQIDEVRVWGLALSGQEIQSTMNLPLTGRDLWLRAYWNFDNGSPTDLGKNHCGGSLVGNAQIVVSDQAALAQGVMFTGAQFAHRLALFTLAAPAGANVEILWSTNLTTWSPLISFRNRSGGIQFVDPDADMQAHAFFRAVLQ